MLQKAWDIGVDYSLDILGAMVWNRTVKNFSRLPNRRLDQAAEQQGIARETARAQLKRIFSKTETNRQAELVRLLLTTPPTGQAN